MVLRVAIMGIEGGATKANLFSRRSSSLLSRRYSLRPIVFWKVIFTPKQVLFIKANPFLESHTGTIQQGQSFSGELYWCRTQTTYTMLSSNSGCIESVWISLFRQVSDSCFALFRYSLTSSVATSLGILLTK